MTALPNPDKQPLSSNDRQWIAWLIAVALIVVGTILGVQFPQLPPTPDDYVPLGVAEGLTNLSGLVVSAPTTFATATPALVVDSDAVSNILEVRDAATPQFYVANGGSYYYAGNGYMDGRLTIANVAQVNAAAAATATPALVVNSAGTSNILEVRDSLTPVAQFYDGGGLDLIANPIIQDIGSENQGVLPSLLSTAITYTAAAGGTGAVATIADGEIWIVHDVYVNVTTDFDCTGDDTTLVIGDGTDTDGWCTLADAELQAADTEGTGYKAGWQCQVAATIGAFGDENNGFIYAPSGAAETIDWILDEGSGESITAGAATIYVLYTRLQ